jgi:hypothetical protein
MYNRIWIIFRTVIQLYRKPFPSRVRFALTGKYQAFYKNFLFSALHAHAATF